jgi:hypothetical protein
MTTITELRKLAEAVYAPNKDDWELKQALWHFDRAANPETIIRLLDLVDQMNVLIYDAIETGDDDPLRDALAAYEEMTK